MIKEIEKILKRHGLKKAGANLAANEIADLLEKKIQDAKGTKKCVVEDCKNRVPDDRYYSICDAHKIRNTRYLLPNAADRT